MTVEQLRSAVHTAPFVPFTLHAADGRAIRVPTSDHIVYNPTGRTVVVLHDDDSWSVLDLLLISEIEFAPVAQAR